MPRISVIMPLYNAAPYVREAVESILAQSFRDFELLVVDDGSSDGGPDIARAISDERVRILEGRANAGPAAARNRGLAAARGSHIVFFDSDDVAVPGMLASLIAAGDDDIVTGWYEGIDEGGRLNGHDHKTAIAPANLAPRMLFKNCIGTSGLFMTRGCLDGQTFDETLEVASDYDMWVRLLVAHKAKQIPRVLARYRSHPENISHRKKAVATECLHRIYSRQLARLGIEAGPNEIDLHARLSGLTFGTAAQTVVAAEKWLLRLDAANRSAGLYPVQPFRETLGDRWHAVCQSAGCNGLWTCWRYFASPLSKWSSPTAQQRYQLLRLSARGALKNFFPVLCVA